MASGGLRELIPTIARTAVAAGVDGLFMEVHDDPTSSPVDGPTQWPLRNFRRVSVPVSERHATIDIICASAAALIGAVELRRIPCQLSDCKMLQISTCVGDKQCQESLCSFTGAPDCVAARMMPAAPCHMIICVQGRSNGCHRAWLNPAAGRCWRS